MMKMQRKNSQKLEVIDFRKNISTRLFLGKMTTKFDPKKCLTIGDLRSHQYKKIVTRKWECIEQSV